MELESICGYFLALAAAPLMIGVINRTKAFFAGRRGQPLWQPYRDMAKLLQKGAVYSRTTTWVFRAGPLAGLAAVLLALMFIPLGGIKSMLSFNGDFLLVAYFLAVMRFCTVAAALDTGSSFEGMGASREVQFSAIAEPALLLGMVVIIRATGQLSLAGGLAAFAPGLAPESSPTAILLFMAWFVVFLVENARIPVDDPNTHLELTMIHEVMVLDHGGPDLAFILYGAALKMWILAALLANVFVPVRTFSPLPDLLAILAGMFLLAVAVGIMESTMARMRLLRVPQLLIAACAFSILALILVVR